MVSNFKGLDEVEFLLFIPLNVGGKKSNPVWITFFQAH